MDTGDSDQRRASSLAPILRDASDQPWEVLSFLDSELPLTAPSPQPPELTPTLTSPACRGYPDLE
jgi:hypothetical protein